MRADQICGWPSAYRWQPQPALECQINPIGQRGFQLGESLPLRFASGDEAAETGNARGETLFFAEECYFSEFERLTPVFFHRLHVCTVLEAVVCCKGEKGERRPFTDRLVSYATLQAAMLSRTV